MIEHSLFPMPMHSPPVNWKFNKRLPILATLLVNCVRIYVCAWFQQHPAAGAVELHTVYRGPVHRGQWFLQVAHRWFLDRIHGPWGPWPDLNRDFWMPLDWWPVTLIRGLEGSWSGILGWYFWLQRGAVRPGFRIAEEVQQLEEGMSYYEIMKGMAFPCFSC